MLSEAILAAVLLGVVRAELTPEELATFSNDGSCGGTVSVTEDGDNYIIQSNGIPNHEWQCVNPNAPSAQNYLYTVPKNPDVTGAYYCLNMGVTGIAVNGVPFYSPLTSDIMNAVEGDTEEGFDSCGAHSSAGGNYHYHLLPVNEDCDNPIYDTDNPDAQFLGIAIDGVPIYSQWGGLDKDKLDICHGMEVNGRYVYVAVSKHFPYIQGCYRALPADVRAQVQCPTEEEGELCVCANRIAGTEMSWFNKCDITCGTGVEEECGLCTTGNEPELAAENSLMQTQSRVKRFLSHMFAEKGRRRRSPRFERQALGDVDQCHSADDENYADGQCVVTRPAGGNMPPPTAAGAVSPTPAGVPVPTTPTGGPVPTTPASGSMPSPTAGDSMPQPTSGGSVPSTPAGGPVPTTPAGGSVTSSDGGQSIEEVELNLMGRSTMQYYNDPSGITTRDSSRAVDGNSDPSWQGNSCSHTQQVENAYWGVNLGGRFKVARVEVTNREGRFGDRLANYHVAVSDIELSDNKANDFSSPDFKLCGSFEGIPPETSSVECAKQEGRFVYIYLPERHHLTLCEVRVFVSEGCDEHPHFCQDGRQCVDTSGFMECQQAYVSSLAVDYTWYPDAEPPSAEHLNEDINQGFGSAYVWLRPVLTTDQSEAASGFEFLRQRNPAIGFQDLARGAKGDYRYIKALTEGGAAVTKVWLQEAHPADEDTCTINLNTGRGGRNLYLCWALSA